MRCSAVKLTSVLAIADTVTSHTGLAGPFLAVNQHPREPGFGLEERSSRAIVAGSGGGGGGGSGGGEAK